MPTISVIVPVYKVEPYIRRCVDSILAQTYRDFELILVDDGSPDSCGMICDEYAEQDSRIHVIHQKNGGLSAARNAGIDWAFANSDSQWLTFVDSDDWVHPQMLKHLLEMVEENKVSVGVCNHLETTGQTPVVSDVPDPVEIWEPENFYLQHTLNATLAWGKLYHKDCFAALRYPAGKIHEDEYITYRIMFAQRQIAYSQMPMYWYFTNAEGITKSVWSVKRMDAVEAVRGQVAYFKENGFTRAYKVAAENFANTIVYHIDSVEKSGLSDMEKQTYQRNLRRQLGHMIWKYKDAYSFRNMQWVYYYAYPLMVARYLRIKDLLQIGK